MGFIKGIFFILISVRCFAAIPLVSVSETWHVNASKAQELAKEQQRPLLIAFLGPEWCPSSDKLEEEILTNRAFLAALNDQLIFLRVDISENIDQGDTEILSLKQKYGIDKCPTLLLVEPAGQEIAKLEYLQCDGKGYASYIKEMLNDYIKVTQLADKKLLKHLNSNELKTLYNQAGKFADSTFKKIFLEEGLKGDQSPYFLIEQYSRVLAERGIKSRESITMRNKIIARDINNEQGYRRQLALMDFDALTKVKNPKGAKTVVKPLIEYLQKFGAKDFENAWDIEMKISQYLFSKDQFKEALKHANASLKIAPESMQKDIVKSIEYLQTFVR